MNLPFKVGKTLGRDHAYWPTLSPAATAIEIAKSNLVEPYRTPQRPSCTLQQQMAIAWRVREWTISGSWGADGTVLGFPVSVSSSPAGTQTSRWRVQFPDVFTRYTAARELDLVTEFQADQAAPNTYITDYALPRRNYGMLFPINVPLIKGEGWIRTAQSTPVPHADNPTAFMLFFADQRPNPFITESSFAASTRGIDITTFEADRFGPYFVFVDGIADLSNGYANLRTTIGSETPNASMTINPGITPAFTAPLLISDAGSFVATSTHCSLTLTATKFWKYTNSHGQDIFDETSGAQINPND